MKIKKSVLISLIIIFVLIVSFSVLLFFYLRENKEERENYLNERITVIYEDNSKTYTFKELTEVCIPQTFNAVYKPSGRNPIEREYKGIELKDLLIALQIDYENAQGIRFKASDGLQKVYNISDIKQQNNVYIAFQVNGKPFNKGILSNAYAKPEEDGGPFVVIRAKDAVSQYRVKMLVEIEVI